MAENYDLSAIAGEYVLGTLDPIERAFVEKERKHNVRLEAEIAFWEAGLFPLTESILPLDPSLQLWNRLEPRLIAVPRQEAVVAPPAIAIDVTAAQPHKPQPAYPIARPQASSGPWKILAIFSLCIAFFAIVYCAALIKFADAPLNPLELFERVWNASVTPGR